jgi:hypothetical protein
MFCLKSFIFWNVILCVLAERYQLFGGTWWLHLQSRKKSRVRNDGKYIVAYRSVAKRWLCKQRPLLGNARNSRRTAFSVVRAEAISGQRLCKHVPYATDTNATIELLLETAYFLCGPCNDVITRTVGAVSLVVSSISQRTTVWAQKQKNLHCWELVPSND